MEKVQLKSKEKSDTSKTRAGYKTAQLERMYSLEVSMMKENMLKQCKRVSLYKISEWCLQETKQRLVKKESIYQEAKKLA